MLYVDSIIFLLSIYFIKSNYNTMSSMQRIPLERPLSDIIIIIKIQHEHPSVINFTKNNP